ncbi:hrp65 protein-like [Penaeus indicus]|uniref:hrp65 protein-like n=1 Tax=Penaeus indicus TaxID=29960 RepID=UPI00300D506C
MIVIGCYYLRHPHRFHGEYRNSPLISTPPPRIQPGAPNSPPKPPSPKFSPKGRSPKLPPQSPKFPLRSPKFSFRSPKFPLRSPKFTLRSPKFPLEARKPQIPPQARKEARDARSRRRRNHRASRPRALLDGAWLVPRDPKSPLELPSYAAGPELFPPLPQTFLSIPLASSFRGEMENGAPQRGRGGPARVTKTPDGRTVQSFRSHPIYGFDKIKEKVMTELNCPQMDLTALDTSEKKFNAQSRLFVGNLPRDIPYEELKEMFSKYGELGQVYFNKDGAYAFINFDYKANAEKAKNELQGKMVRNRPMKIRYASVTTGVRVKNLTPYVSNELLHKSFSVFGEIESCRVIVDDRGKTTGDGVVVFCDKKGATIALKKCQEECYFLTSSLRPVIVEPLEAGDEEEGNPENSMHKNNDYRNERKEGPRFADRNSFEFEYGMRWKRLYEMYKEKKMLLESDLQAEMEQLEARFALVRHEHETEKLRRELMAREAEAMQMGRYRQSSNYQDRYMGGSQENRYSDYHGSARPNERYQQAPPISSEERYSQGPPSERYPPSTPEDRYPQARSTEYSQQGGVKREPATEDFDMKRTRY